MTIIKMIKTRCSRVKLVLMCRFTAENLTNDLGDFTQVAKIINEESLTSFKTLTEEVSGIIGPVALRKLAKAITRRINDTMNDLSFKVNCLELVVDAAYSSIDNMTSHDFGIDALRHALTSHKTLKVLPALKVVNDNIANYQEVLIGEGLSTDLIGSLVNAYASINEDLTARYGLKSEIKKAVHENRKKTEELFTYLRYVQAVGQVIYHKRDPARELLYTFSSVIKSIAPAARKPGEAVPTPPVA
jgi:hypothetical protein